MRKNVHGVALTTPEHIALCAYQCDGTPWQNVASPALDPALVLPLGDTSANASSKRARRSFVTMPRTVLGCRRGRVIQRSNLKFRSTAQFKIYAWFMHKTATNDQTNIKQTTGKQITTTNKHCE